MKSIKLLNILIFLTAIAAISVVAIYTYQFSGNGFSASPEAWGQLGDYMGGLLNPLLSLINICVFVMLTIVIQQATDKNNDAAISSAKRVALMQMKHEELTHFKKEMDNRLEKMKSGKSSTSEAQDLLTTYNVLEYRMLFLFPELNELESNKSLRRYIVENLYSVKLDNKTGCGSLIPVSNVYGMLVSDLSKLVVT